MEARWRAGSAETGYSGTSRQRYRILPLWSCCMWWSGISDETGKERLCKWKVDWILRNRDLIPLDPPSYRRWGRFVRYMIISCRMRRIEGVVTQFADLWQKSQKNKKSCWHTGICVVLYMSADEKSGARNRNFGLWKLNRKRQLFEKQYSRNNDN